MLTPQLIDPDRLRPWNPVGFSVTEKRGRFLNVYCVSEMADRLRRKEGSRSGG